jgi:hypothetical protein
MEAVAHFHENFSRVEKVKSSEGQTVIQHYAAIPDI